MTHLHPPIAPIHSRSPEEAAVAESCYSRWSPLFGNGPDHVTTKWWKLWAVCKLSISTERLGAGNKAGNLDAHPCSETQEDRDSRAPAAVSRWMLQCGDKKKREIGICSCVFFFSPLTASRQEARVREGLLSSALCCGSGCEAAQHPPWRLHITADAGFLILQL